MGYIYIYIFVGDINLNVQEKRVQFLYTLSCQFYSLSAAIRHALFHFPSQLKKERRKKGRNLPVTCDWRAA